MTELSHVVFPENEFPKSEDVSLDETLSTHLALQACKQYLHWRDKGFDASAPLSMPDYIPDFQRLPPAPPEYATETIDYTKCADDTFYRLGAPDQQRIVAKTFELFGDLRPEITEEERAIRRRGALVGHVIDRLSLQE